MLSSKSTLRKVIYQNKQLKTEVIWSESHQNFSMLAMLSYTQKVWAVGFRPLVKQINFYLSWLCVEMPSIMVPWHIYITNYYKYITNYILQSTIHRIFVVCAVLMEAIFPCFNLKPDDCNLATTILVHKLSQLKELRNTRFRS